VSAVDIEALVTRSVREHFGLPTSTDDRSLVESHVLRIELQAKTLAIHLAQQKPGPRRRKGASILRIPWQQARSTRRREILVPECILPQQVRPIRSETRATLIASISRGRRWPDELLNDKTASTERIAHRENCSVRQANMTISLAFLAPGIVKAAIEGRLPRGIGVTRLRDAPAEWARQYAMLGLTC
jgi:hypothetical protein